MDGVNSTNELSEAYLCFCFRARLCLDLPVCGNGGIWLLNKFENGFDSR